MLFDLLFAAAVVISSFTSGPVAVVEPRLEPAIVLNMVEVDEDEADPYAGMPKEMADMYRLMNAMFDGVINGTDV